MLVAFIEFGYVRNQLEAGKVTFEFWVLTGDVNKMIELSAGESVYECATYCQKMDCTGYKIMSQSECIIYK